MTLSPVPDLTSTNLSLLQHFDHSIRGRLECAASGDAQQFDQLWVGKYSDWFIATTATHSLHSGQLRDETRRAIHWINTQDRHPVRKLSWQTYSHHTSPALANHLARLGFTAHPTNTVMAGPASHLTTLPPTTQKRLTVRQIQGSPGCDATFTRDCHSLAALLRSAFGAAHSPSPASLASDASSPLRAVFLAEHDGAIVGTGRVILDGRTGWAGLWGGCVRPSSRGHGIYRALLSARASWAIQHGAHLIRSECSPKSRPILEHAGLSRLTSSTLFTTSPAAATLQQLPAGLPHLPLDRWTHHLR